MPPLLVVVMWMSRRSYVCYHGSSCDGVRSEPSLVSCTAAAAAVPQSLSPLVPCCVSAVSVVVVVTMTFLRVVR